MMNGQGMMGGFFGMGVSWLLIIGIIIVVVALLMKFSSGNQQHSANHQDSLATLKQRLAKGEITEEEYDRLKKKIVE
ncbi:hypothetical protein GLW08_05075 [Pontibacillus yanchengensis]|uniref:SHOCT domain-containing protein n=2 Tax=Pontibacillus yanchengensis TaxID=462910 RepID=A0A6I4ZUX5_9BACI|nr:SHOCT domain-containing protein [Pontibacillus yanchengensis]MYL32127.1 hypothetical protein [Pontibacillus yanchengensis]MYL52707.1 hypothetical protein [Pontibacillus yanchengensis]